MPEQAVYFDMKVGPLAITRADNQKIPAGNRNYMIARFNFSSDWDGLDPIAVFTRTGLVFHVPINNNACGIPSQVMAKPGSLNVTVFAGDRRVARAVVIEIVPSGYQDETPQEPPKDKHTFVQSEKNNIRFIREKGGKMQYYYDGWHNVIGKVEEGVATVYRHNFAAADWEPYLTGVRLLIPVDVHRQYTDPWVSEVRRNDSGYADAVMHTSRRYTNGDIALICDMPFDGQAIIQN